MLTFGHSVCKRKPPRMCWSGCSLLVDDLKAAAALLSSVVVEAGCQRLQAIVIDVPCMHHAPSDWRSASTRRDSLTDMNPSTTRAGSLSNVARHRPRCAAAARCSESSAAATEKAATAHHRGRPRCSDKHSGHSGAMPAATVGQPQWSAACSGCPRRWGRWYGRLERYTNVFRVPEHVQRKIGTYPVHLGLDHTAAATGATWVELLPSAGRVFEKLERLGEV